MRTTITLDEDVLDKARFLEEKLNIPLRAVINKALRIGLVKVEQAAKQRRCQAIPHDMGLQEGYDLDNIQELLAQAEGEDYR